eukprot:12197-Pelagococcus_subviridis.AAC.1
MHLPGDEGGRRYTTCTAGEKTTSAKITSTPTSESSSELILVSYMSRGTVLETGATRICVG